MASAEVPLSAPPPAAPLVVVAPVTTGRSVILRSFYNTELRIGQMLVKINRLIPDAAIEVMELLFPDIKAECPSARDQARHFLGHLKVEHPDYWILVFEIRVEPVAGGFPNLQYRIMHPSGRIFQQWYRLDLSYTKLRTTPEQRAAISKLTGVIYMAPREDVPKQVWEPKRHPAGRSQHQQGHKDARPPIKSRGLGMDNLFNRAGVTPSHIKDQLKPHAQIRSDLQRGLPAPPVSAQLPAAGAEVDQQAIAELAAKAGQAAAPVAADAAIDGAVAAASGPGESVVEIQATIVTSAKPVSAPAEGTPAGSPDAEDGAEVGATDPGRSVVADGVGA